jgi:tRNA (cytidine/uridine-2'-O-)-methyltransferase
MGRKVNTFVEKDQRKPEDRKLTRPDGLRIVLLHPRIPQNTGSIARLCAATGSRLELIRPLFEIDDRKLIRAGLDYWPLLDVVTYASLEEWLEKNPESKPWIVENTGKLTYSEARFQKADVLFFGDEQDGIPDSLLDRFPERSLRIPQQNVRSMNLAMCVGIVSFEALRQLDFLSMK